MRPEVLELLLLDILYSDHLFLALGPRHRGEFFDFTGDQGV